jgi:hypothetical protein
MKRKRPKPTLIYNTSIYLEEPRKTKKNIIGQPASGPEWKSEPPKYKAEVLTTRFLKLKSAILMAKIIRGFPRSVTTYAHRPK